MLVCRIGSSTKQEPRTQVMIWGTMEARSTAIFAAIVETRSLTVIHYAVENELKIPMDSEDRALLEQIQGLNSLDEIYILCNNRIAAWHLKCANAIRQFIEAKKGRR
jgi:hypothetical protein